MLYSEEKLEKYSSPIGKTEEERCRHALGMLRDALKGIGYTDDGKEMRALMEDTFSFSLDMRNSSGRNIVLLVQGSYANKTNISNESDVDLAVILESTFITEYRPGISRENYGFTAGTYTALELKDEVERALKQYYKDGVERHDKSIRVYGNSYRVDADVVPAYRLRDYTSDYDNNASNYLQGIEIRPDSGGIIRNYPEVHIKLGIAKNKATSYKYKRIVRIIKHIKEDMKSSGIVVSKEISSFGIESMLWNVDCGIYNKYSSYRFIVDEVIKELVRQKNQIDTFLEANGIKKLCDTTAKQEAYIRFINQLSDYYEYEI